MRINRPIVSIITLTWNRRSFLCEALESLCSQTFRDFEVLVMDDGSQDGTQDLIREFHERLHLRYFPLAHSGHLSHLRNLGLGEARGEFVCFLDSDDLWYPEKLGLQVETTLKYRHAAFSYCGFKRTENTGNVRVHTYREAADPHAADSVGDVYAAVITGATPVYPSTLLLRRSVLDRAGFPDKNFRVGDYEFLVRLSSISEAAILHSPLVEIRKHPGNHSPSLEVDDLSEAITAVERHYTPGRIPRRLIDETLLRYRSDLMRAQFRRRDLAEASAQLQACATILESQAVDDVA